MAPHVDAVESWPECHQEPPDLPRALSKPQSARQRLIPHAGGAACSWRGGSCRVTEHKLSTATAGWAISSRGAQRGICRQCPPGDGGALRLG